MRSVFVVLALLALGAVASAKEFKLYAMFLADTRVELSDGSIWMMDKGDVFPVQAYKNMQKNIVLQLAGASFITDTVKVRVLKQDEVEAGLETYRKNVRAYLESKSGKIQEDLQGELPEKAGPSKPAKPKKP